MKKKTRAGGSYLNSLNSLLKMHETWSTNSLTLRGQKEGGLGGLLACEINALDFRLNVFSMGKFGV